MGRRDDVLEEFRRQERDRIDDWRDSAGVGRVVAKAARGIARIESGTTATLHAPFEIDLAVVPSWHTNGAVVQADDLQVYVRVIDVKDGAVTRTEVHPVGPCLRCGLPVPVGPVDGSEDFPAALYAGVPASGHVCAG